MEEEEEEEEEEQQQQQQLASLSSQNSSASSQGFKPKLRAAGSIPDRGSGFANRRGGNKRRR